LKIGGNNVLWVIFIHLRSGMEDSMWHKKFHKDEMLLKFEALTKGLLKSAYPLLEPSRNALNLTSAANHEPLIKASGEKTDIMGGHFWQQTHLVVRWCIFDIYRYCMK
jgi:hypothetical protein